MQLRLRPRSQNRFFTSGRIIKITTVILAIFAIIFFLGKLEMPAPKELIKQKISNDKLIKLK